MRGFHEILLEVKDKFDLFWPHTAPPLPDDLKEQVCKITAAIAFDIESRFEYEMKSLRAPPERSRVTP